MIAFRDSINLVSVILLVTQREEVCKGKETVRWLIALNIIFLCLIVQELCESRGGRPGLSVLTSLLVSVDVKIY